MIGGINHNEGNEFAQNRKSCSALDFRLDPEKLSDLYGLPKIKGSNFDIIWRLFFFIIII